MPTMRLNILNDSCSKRSLDISQNFVNQLLALPQMLVTASCRQRIRNFFAGGKAKISQIEIRSELQQLKTKTTTL